MSTPPPAKPPIYGYLVEFDNADALIAAARSTKDNGYAVFEAYTPFPLHALSDIVGHENRLPWIVFAGGVFGACAGFGLQYWVSVIEYPLNIGGRPMNSWPAFIVPMFETTILCAALSAVFGMLWLNGLPQPYHPVFNVPHFTEASRSGFFLMILSRDPKFDMVATKRFLATQQPLTLAEVPH
ncbi:MAG: DUF3341 domain-containing protein [Planctomycetota bacterium]